MSLDSQVDELRRFAAERGLDVSEEFTESASARAPGRPIFADLMKRLRAGKVKSILTWRLDRLARNMVDGGAIIYELSEGRLEQIITPEATYTNTGDAKFMLALQFGAASKYTDDLSAAVRRGNKRVLEMGKVPGPVPLGYLKSHEHESSHGSGIVVPDPERFDLVKRLWKELLANPQSVMSLWRKARDEWGLTSRPTRNTLAHPITLTGLYAILRNPFYTGKLVRNGEVFRGEHAPMITQDEFDRVQTHFKHPRARPRSGQIQFLYTGLLHCGHCGRMLSGERHEKHGHVYIYYRCGRRRDGYFRCNAPAVRESEVTEAVAQALAHIRIDPTFLAWALKAMEWWSADDIQSPDRLVQKAKRQLSKAEREMVTLTDLVVAGTLSETEYKVRRLNQQKHIEHLREALTEPMERLEAWRTAHAGNDSTGVDLARRFTKGSDPEKRAIVGRVCSNVLVTNRRAAPQLRTPFARREQYSPRSA